MHCGKITENGWKRLRENEQRKESRERIKEGNKELVTITETEV